MLTTVTATYAKNNLGEIVDYVMSSHKTVTITRFGRPIVLITPAQSKTKFNSSS